MEPIANQAGVSQTVRPVLALSGDLSAVLREGRVIAGEVLQGLDGKSLLVGVGRHRVPAESQVELQPGDRFLARVEQTEEGTVLRVLGGRRGSVSPLLLALRNVVGEDKPVGELLQDLARSLRSAIDRLGDADRSLTQLIKNVGEHVYRPGSTSEELQLLLSRAGFKYEARLLGAILQGGGFKGAQELSPGLIAALIGELKGFAASAGAPFSAGELARLADSLKLAFEGFAALPQTGSGAASPGALLRALGRALAAALESLPDGPRRAALEAGLPRALGRLLGDGQPTALGSRVLAALADARTHLALTGNLKAQLLAALEGGESGPVRDAIARALAGIESEQLLNLARKEFQEGWHLSLPVPDGERWATAHFFYRDSGGDGDGTGNGDGLQRLTMTVDFTALGPLRAEIGVRADLVALRLVVTTEDVATEIRSRLDDLTGHLASGDRVVRVAVTVGTSEDVEVDSHHQNIRWLREHHLMDLSG